MGEKMVGEFASILSGFEEPKFCSTPDGDRALQRMLTRVESVSDVHLPLRVQVLDHKMINAFALPGGQIVLFRGLIDKADSPEEVAGVLAHEIGHVVNRDPTRIALRSAGSAGLLGLLLGDFTGATVTVALSEALLRSGYQREAEAAADDFANAALSAQGLPTKPFAGFFLKLNEMSVISQSSCLICRPIRTLAAGRQNQSRLIRSAIGHSRPPSAIRTGLHCSKSAADIAPFLRRPATDL